MPLSTSANRLVGGTNRNAVSTIYLQAASTDPLSAAYQEAQALLLNLHQITSASSADFTIANQQSLLATATSVSKTLTILLTGIAALSLLVGGIGVMNIMLVSVTERTREIGLRKALGAPPGAIRRQFLVEAVVLGLGGGILGAALGIAVRHGPARPRRHHHRDLAAGAWSGRSSSPSASASCSASIRRPGPPGWPPSTPCAANKAHEQQQPTQKDHR